MKALVVGLAMAALAITPSIAAGDAAAGAKVFNKCKACHAAGEGAQNRVGPQLNGLIGRTAGTAPDFNYSQAMMDAGAGGLIWSAETLHQFLIKPKDFVNGTKMAFPGLKDEKDIDNVIAYLSTLAPDGTLLAQ